MILIILLLLGLVNSSFVYDVCSTSRGSFAFRHGSEPCDDGRGIQFNGQCYEVDFKVINGFSNKFGSSRCFKYINLEGDIQLESTGSDSSSLALADRIVDGFDTSGLFDIRYTMYAENFMFASKCKNVLYAQWYYAAKVINGDTSTGNNWAYFCEGSTDPKPWCSVGLGRRDIKEEICKFDISNTTITVIIKTNDGGSISKSNGFKQGKILFSYKNTDYQPASKWMVKNDGIWTPMRDGPNYDGGCDYGREGYSDWSNNSSSPWYCPWTAPIYCNHTCSETGMTRYDSDESWMDPDVLKAKKFPLEGGTMYQGMINTISKSGIVRDFVRKFNATWSFPRFNARLLSRPCKISFDAGKYTGDCVGSFSVNGTDLDLDPYNNVAYGKVNATCFGTCDFPNCFSSCDKTDSYNEVSQPSSSNILNNFLF